MMATCKECLHFEMCYIIEGNPWEGDVDGVENDCYGFKDKTKYVEQKHGRWEIIHDDYDCEMMQCSCCGAEFYDGDNDTVDSLHNCCPNCGAKMDGV